MAKDIKKFKPGVIYVKHESLSFLNGDNDVILPRMDEYLPRNDGNIITYEEGPEGKETTYYSIEDKEGNFEALYGVNKDGSVSFKRKGEPEVLVPAKKMEKISKRTVRALSEHTKVISCGGNNNNPHKEKRVHFDLVQAYLGGSER